MIKDLATEIPCEPTVSRPRPRATDQSLFVAIRYVECKTRPVRLSPSGCGCDEAVCEYTRIRDSFEINCLTDAPTSDDDVPSVCALVKDKQLPLCPPCPDEPWVLLAKASLPESLRAPIAATAIDNWSYRRQLFSTAALQEQLIKCCCQAALIPAKVSSIVPPNNKRYSAGGDPRPEKITITFDKALKKETVTVKSVLVSMSKQDGSPPTGIAGKVSYKPDTLTAEFTPDQAFPASPGGLDYVFTVTVKGDGPNAIRDVDGLALDGDGNGQPGADFTSKFLITLSA